MSEIRVSHANDQSNKRAWRGDAVWLGGKAYKEDAIDDIAETLLSDKEPCVFALNVYVMEHGIGTWPLHGEPRFEALINDPVNNAPTF